MPAFLVELEDGRKFNVDSDIAPTDDDINDFLNQGAPPATAISAAPSDSFLGQAYQKLRTGTQQAIAGAKTTLAALGGFNETTGQGLSELAAAAQQSQAERTPQDIAFQNEMKQNAAEFDAASGFMAKAGEFVDYAGIAARNPRAAFQMGLQSLPNAVISLPAAAAGKVIGAGAGALAGIETGPGAVVTGAAGMALGSVGANFLMEGGGAIADKINEATGGKSANWTPEQFTAYVQANPQIVNAGLKSGAVRGAIIGGVDAASMGIAGRIMKPAVGAVGKAGTLGRGAAATGVEMASEGGGEALAGYVDKGKVDSEAVAQEMLGGIGSGIPTAIVGRGLTATFGKPQEPTADAPLTEDLGDLTADEVADLEQPIISQPQPPASSSASQSLQTPPAPASFPPQPTAIPAAPGTGPGPVRPILPSTSEAVSSGQLNTPAQTPQAAAFSGISPQPAAALTPVTEESLATVKDSLTVAPTADPASIANIGIRAAVGAGEARRRPVIPDSPLGSPDLLDFLNDNPIGAPSELELSNENWEAQTQIPKTLRKFITDPAGRAPEQVAEEAFNNNLIDAPTPDALIAKISEVSAARESAAALAKGQAQDNQGSERQAKAFERTQRSLANAPDAQAVPVDDLRQGQTISIGGTPVKVTAVKTDDDGRNTQVTLDGGPDFGRIVLNNDGNLIMADQAPTSQPNTENGTPTNLSADPFSPSRERVQAERVVKQEMEGMGLPTEPGSYRNGAVLVKRALAAIVGNKSLPATLRMMAKVLKGANLNNLFLRIESDGRKEYAGLYQDFGKGQGEVSLNMRGHAPGQTVAETLVHEVLHHATYRALRNPQNQRQNKSIAALENLRTSLQGRPGASEWAYQLSNTDEFISGLFTLPGFQQWLANQPSPEGLGTRFKNALAAIFNSLAQLVTGKDVVPGSALDVAFEESLSLVETPEAKAAAWSNSRATPADTSNVVQMPDGAQMVGPSLFSITAYHGTPHKVDKFRLDKIGTGEGAQAYGWGLYFAQAQAVAEQYQRTVAGERYLGTDANDKWRVFEASVNGEKAVSGPFENSDAAKTEMERMGRYAGNLYTVELLPDDADFLDWDKPLSEQSEKVQAALQPYLSDLLKDVEKRRQWAIQNTPKAFSKSPWEASDKIPKTGRLLYDQLAKNGIKAASEKIASLGIPGIRYLDGGSRHAGDGTRNFVIFDENLVKILEENGQPAQDTRGEALQSPTRDSLSRTRNGGNVLTFDTPIQTPLGEVLAYQWQSTLVEQPDQEGEMKIRRVSDWTKAETNAETGRDIVHHFAVRKADGEIFIVSLESALKATKGTEEGKTISALVKAARRLPVREAELAELKAKRQAANEDYDRTRQMRPDMGKIALKDPDFQHLRDNGSKKVELDGVFVAILRADEITDGKPKDMRRIWDDGLWQWQDAQRKVKMTNAETERLATLERAIKKDKQTLAAAKTKIQDGPTQDTRGEALQSPTRLAKAAKVNVTAWSRPQNSTDITQSVEVSKESIGVSPALEQVLKTGLKNIKAVWNFDAPFASYTFGGERAEMPRFEALTTGPATRIGEYRSDKQGRSTLAVREGPEAQNTFHHEYGHLIDHRMLGTGEFSASEINKVPAMKELMTFLGSTESTTKLKALRKKERKPKDIKHIDYLLQPDEQFARAFEFATAALLGGTTPNYEAKWQEYVEFTEAETRAIIAHVNAILDHLRRVPYARSQDDNGRGVPGRLGEPSGDGALSQGALRDDRGASPTERQGNGNDRQVAAPLASPTRPPPRPGFDYTQARWAAPSLDEQLYPIAANEEQRAIARDWHMGLSLRDAVEALEQETTGLPAAAVEMARGFAIRRAAIMRDSTNELDQAIGSGLLHRASKLRNEQRRAAAQDMQAGIVTNRELVPFAPILAAENALIDRADAVMKKRFTGGAAAAAAEVQAVATAAGAEASANVAAILDDATTPPPLPPTAEEQARVKELERQLTEARQNLTSQRNANSTFQQILEVLKGAGAGKAKVLAGAKDAALQAIRMAKAMAQARAAGQTPQQSPTGNTQQAANAAAPDLDPDVLLAVATGALFDNTNSDTFRQVMVAEFGPSVTPQLDSLYEKGMVKMRDLLITSAAKVKSTKGKASQPKPAKSPNLSKLLNLLRRQTFPGLSWTDIFSELSSEQKTRQRELYQRVKDHPQLGALTPEQRLELTNALDKVWQEERRKAVEKEIKKVTTPRQPADKAKLQKAMPKLLRWINLGVMDADTFRAAIAPAYGHRTMTAAEASRLKAMAEEAYNLPDGVLRDRKLAAMLASMQKVTGLSRSEILNSYWTASVLSGLRTQFVVGMAALNGLADIGYLSGMQVLRGKPGVALQAMGAFSRAFTEALADCWQIIARGDYTILKRFNEDLKSALDGNKRHWRPVPLGEALWANGTAWSKAPAAVMIFTGRLMAAADHITSTATTAGAMVIARARYPELYATAAPSAAERASARQQATMEVTGGAPPTAAEAATIRARIREILAGVMDPATYQEASFIGDQAAMQNRPSGVMGAVYDIANDLASDVERKLNNVSKNEQALPAARALATLVGALVRPLTGTQFLRAGFNVGNQFISYMPGTAVLSLARQKLFADPLSKTQNELLIGRNVAGLVVASAIVAALVGKDDEEEGWHIEGLQENLTKEQKALRLSTGIEPGSVWKRENGKVVSYLYRDNPLAGIFASVGAAQDIYRADPEQFKREGVLRHILRGYALGLMQVKEANAMGALMEAIGASSYSADPEGSLMKSITKLPKSFVGGLIPTIVKDAEIWNDPRRFKPEGILQELQAQVPFLRTSVNGGMPALDRLGNEIQQNRAPWSRALVTSPSTPAKAALAKLMARGLDLPGVGTRKLIRLDDGSKVPLETLGPKAVHDYTKAVGKRWATYLTSEDGAELLTMDTERAAKIIRHKDDVFKIQAMAEVKR